MKSKKGLLKKSRLYVIIDKETCARRPLADVANKITNKGEGIFQYRDKVSNKETVLRNARRLKKSFDGKGLFIINDFLDVAKIIDCDGLHFGQGDLSLKLARQFLGPNKIIGISCHSLKQAIDAQNCGADYIGIGPIFPTSTKPGMKSVGLGLIKAVSKKIKIPFFAIGGINRNNLNSVLSSGAKRVAICSAICKAKNINRELKRIREAISYGPI